MSRDRGRQIAALEGRDDEPGRLIKLAGWVKPITDLAQRVLYLTDGRARIAGKEGFAIIF